MTIQLLPAIAPDKPLIHRMMQLLQHDISPFEDTDLNDHGYFNYPYLDHYWVEAERHPFIIRVTGNLAGFVLVNQHTYLPENQYSVAEFFVMRKYRRRGIGSTVAKQTFDSQRGRWEIKHKLAHKTARQFWQATLNGYAASEHTERIIEEETGTVFIRSFDNRAIMVDLT